MTEEGPIPAEQLQQYSTLVVSTRNNILDRKETRTLVVSGGENDVELDYLLNNSSLWPYVHNLFSVLPVQDRSVLSPRPTFAEIGSYFGRELYLGHLRKVLAVNEQERHFLHDFKARNLDSVHFYYHTDNPLVFYHKLGCSVPVEGPGWGGDFITVGLTENQLKQFSQQSGAQFGSDIYRTPANIQVERRRGNWFSRLFKR